MLKFLSRRKRTARTFLWGIIIVLALGMLGLFTIVWQQSAGSADDSVVARVGSLEITAKEYRDALSRYGQQIAQGQGAVRRDSPAKVYELYGEQVLEELIRQKIILYEAERLNLQTTDTELQDNLKKLPGLSPWPGPEVYREQLARMGVTAFEFEESVRTSITEQKLRSYVTAAAQAPASEVEEDYRSRNSKYTIRWAEVRADNFRDKIQFTDADIRAYFDSRRSDFRINTDQRRARYIFINQAKAGETIQISDDELRQKFNPERNVQQVRVSQITLNIPKPKTDNKTDSKKTEDEDKPTPEEETRKKADEIVGRARGAEGKPAEDFAKLARELSEDQKTKPAGGDLGWVNKKDKRETDDPLNRVFNMQKDQISEPIKKGDRFYILKVTDRRLPTFEESREQLIKDVRSEKGYTKAVDIAIEAEQKFKETNNIEATVAEINQKYNAQVAEVKETPFFAQGDSLPDLGAAVGFQDSVFELQNPGDIGSYLNVNNGFAVPQYIEKRDPHDPTFEEVKARVQDRYRTDKAREQALALARQIAQASSPDALKSAADARKLKPDERVLSGTDSIGSLTNEAERAKIYKLKEGEVLREPIKLEDGDNYFVASMVKRADADMGAEFQKQRRSIEEGLLATKRNAMFMSYLAWAQKQLQQQGKIKIYQKVIDTAIVKAPEGDIRPVAPPAPPRPTRRAPGQ
ncbi:MAG: SurA N-terminal domain-containing protein [Acidobacteriota bacterium]